MKRIFKTMIVLTMVLAITFAFAGCKIVVADGEWVCNKMKMTTTYSDTTTDLLQFGGEMTIVLDEDGSMTIDGKIPMASIENSIIIDSGKWSLDGTTITLDGQIKDVDVEWVNNKLIYTIEEVVGQSVDEDGQDATHIIVCELVKQAK